MGSWTAIATGIDDLVEDGEGIDNLDTGDEAAYRLLICQWTEQPEVLVIKGFSDSDIARGVPGGVPSCG